MRSSWTLGEGGIGGRIVSIGSKAMLMRVVITRCSALRSAVWKFVCLSVFVRR